jgi:hypothetical protein
VFHGDASDHLFAQEIRKCAACGVLIGGQNHNPVAGQTDLDGKLAGDTGYFKKSTFDDKSEPGYQLRDCDGESNMFITARSPPRVDRCLRFIMHAVCVLGIVVGHSESVLRSIFNRGHTNPAQAHAFLLAHCLADWRLLQKALSRNAEATGVMLHMVLEALVDNGDASVLSAGTNSVLIVSRCD